MTATAPQILTTPTKGYNLRNRLVPLCSPDHLNGQAEDNEVDDIQNEPPPPEMNELACEALTEELKQMQVLTKNFFCFKGCFAKFQSSIPSNLLFVWKLLGLSPKDYFCNRVI